MGVGISFSDDAKTSLHYITSAFSGGDSGRVGMVQQDRVVALPASKGIPIKQPHGSWGMCTCRWEERSVEVDSCLLKLY